MGTPSSDILRYTAPLFCFGVGAPHVSSYHFSSPDITMSRSSDLSQRPSYSQSQIESYFKHIAFPSHTQQQLPRLHERGQEQHALEFLRLLQIHQLSSIPFENLSLHYSPHHTISIDPDGLFEKLVGNGRGRGGYCMENNCFFGTMMRSLGFELYSAGARVCEDGINYTPWCAGIQELHRQRIG